MKALLLIDVQKGFDDAHWGIRNNFFAEKNIELLLKIWRKQKWPVFHIQHLSLEPESSLRAGTPGVEFRDFISVLESETIIQKHVNSAFIGTTLEEQLRRQSCSSLVLVGLTTDHCVSTTSRMAANLGFEVTVVADATATFQKEFRGRIFLADELHDSALASLNKEFAKIVNTCDFFKVPS